jgi:histidinol-phosphatase
MNEFLEFAIRTVKNTRKILLRHYTNTGTAYKHKADNSPVTLADAEIENSIVSAIKKTYPGHSVIGEESGTKETASDYTWVIDPIDGTKNFTRGVPLFGTLLALMKNNEIIVGVSYMTLFDELMYAAKGNGAFLNGQPIRTTNVKQLNEAYISSGSLHYFDKQGLKQRVVDLREHCYQYRLIGDIYAYHLLAQGKIDAVIEGSVKLYDIAPVKLIIEEAGGTCSDLDGNDITPNVQDFVATNGHLHKELLGYLHQSR